MQTTSTRRAIPNRGNKIKLRDHPSRPDRSGSERQTTKDLKGDWWRAAASVRNTASANAAPAPIHLVQGGIHSRLSEIKRVPSCTKRARDGAAESEEAWQPRRRAGGWWREREGGDFYSRGAATGSRGGGPGSICPRRLFGKGGRLFFFEDLLVVCFVVLLFMPSVHFYLPFFLIKKLFSPDLKYCHD
jgi:hypothetical protein